MLYQHQQLLAVKDSDQKMVVGKVVLVNFTNFWTITSFSNLYNEKVAKMITSPEFPIMEQCTAYLRLDINDPNNAQLKDYISLYIFLKNYQVEKEIRIQYKLSVLGSDKTEMLSSQNMRLFTDNFGYGNRCLIKKKELMSNLKDKLLPDDKLTIICKITVLDQTANVQFEQCSIELKNLFENKNFTDVTLCVDGKEIQAHKAILVSKSPIFYAILNTREKIDTLQIADISYNVVTELLRFIYTGQVKNLQDLGKDLFIAADKYNINELKNMCENHFVCSVTLENAAEMLIFAELHNAQHLKSCTQNVISKNVKKFIKTPGFLGLKKSHSSLMLEIVWTAIEKLG